MSLARADNSTQRQGLSKLANTHVVDTHMHAEATCIITDSTNIKSLIFTDHLFDSVIIISLTE